MKPRTLPDLLAQSSHKLQRIRQRSAQLDRLLAHIRDVLPPPLASHCTGVAVKADALIIYIDASAVASKVRFLAPQVHSSLPPAMRQRIRHVEARVLRARGAPLPLRRRAAMSTDSAHIIHASAECVTDPELGAALHRLARHGEDEN